MILQTGVFPLMDNILNKNNNYLIKFYLILINCDFLVFGSICLKLVFINNKFINVFEIIIDKTNHRKNTIFFLLANQNK